MTIDEELDQYLWAWVNLGDDNVCPDCERYSQMPAMPFQDWIEANLEPGNGNSACGLNCRCALVPDDILQVATDLRDSGKIVIGELGELTDITATSYQLFSDLDDLIVEYKAATGNAKLPKEWYAITSVKGRIEFLIDFLG
jgi:hypothetical protein